MADAGTAGGGGADVSAWYATLPVSQCALITLLCLLAYIAGYFVVSVVLPKRRRNRYRLSAPLPACERVVYREIKR